MTKLVVFVLAVFVAIGVASFALVIQDDDVSSAPPGPPGDLVAPSFGRAPLIVECYELVDGATPDEVVQLETRNFGRDRVQVGTAIAFCEGARKIPVGLDPIIPLGEPGRFVFECFLLEHGDNPADPVQLRTVNFGEEDVIVGQAEIMCESARKDHTLADGTTASLGDPGRAAWECFHIEGTDRITEVELITRNFGTDLVTVADPAFMCEEARKTSRDATGTHHVGQAGGLVWECFNLRSEVVRNEPIRLTTSNFGEDDVIAVTPVLMCERARKTEIFSFDIAPVVTPTPRVTPTPTPG